MELTPRQADILLFVRNSRHLRGYAPTFRELAEGLGISRATTVAHVKRMVKKKLLAHTPGKARTLEVLADQKAKHQDDGNTAAA